jgi:hypothetical protein
VQQALIRVQTSFLALPTFRLRLPYGVWSR